MSDTLSPHRTLFNAWLALLATITTANGYNTNIGQHVFQFRDTDAKPIEAGEIPCCNVTYTYTATPQGPGGCADCVMTIVVEAVAGTAEDQATAIQQCADDIARLCVRNPYGTGYFQSAYAGTPTAFDLTVADKHYGGAECKITLDYSIKGQSA